MSKEEKSLHGRASKDNTILTLNAASAIGRRYPIPLLISVSVRVITLAIWSCLQLFGVGSSVNVALASSHGTLIASAEHSVATDTGGPSIHFPEPAFDFGTVSQGTKVSHIFVVKNTGDKPLQLIRAKAS